MPINKSWVEKLLLFLIEWVLLLTISLLFYKWGGPPIHRSLPILSIGILLTGGIYLIRYKLKSYNMNLYYVVSLVVVLVTWLLFSWPILLSLVFTLYFLWRLMALLEDETDSIRWWLYMITVFGALILWLFIKQPDIHHELLFILISQTVFVIGYEMVQEWRLSKRLAGSLTYLIAFIGILVIGYLITFFLPVISWVINLIIKGILLIATGIAAVLWYFMSRFLGPSVRKKMPILNNLLKNIKKNHKQPIQQQVVHHGFNSQIFLALLILILIVLSFFVIRKVRLSGLTSESRQMFEISESTFSTTQKRSRFFNFRAPKDPIRARVFQLQRRLRKQESNRLEAETIGEWLNRVTANNELRTAIQLVYEKVRYGNPKWVSEEEKLAFEKAIEQVEFELKETYQMEGKES